MAAATAFEVQPTSSENVAPNKTESSAQTTWNRVQKSLTKVEGQVRDQLATFRKTVDSARAKGTERLAELKTIFAPAKLKELLTNNKAIAGFTKNAEKVLEDGKKLTDAAEKLGLAKLADLQDLAKKADIDALKDAFAGVQGKLDHLRQKVDKLASKAPATPVSNQSAE